MKPGVRKLLAVAPAPRKGTEGGLRELKKGRARDEILHAAREVFIEIGYSAATIRDIVRRTELSPGTFYNYFPNKEAVFREIVEHTARDLRARLLEVRGTAENPVELVRNGFRAALEAALTDPTLTEILRRNSVELLRRDVDASGEIPVGALIATMMDDLGADLQAAIDRGEMPQFDVEYMVAGMSVAVIEIAYTMLQRDPPDIDGATNFLTELFAGGVMFMAMQANGRADGGAAT